MIMIEDILKLLLAILIGGLLGAEREFHDKAAGFRTLIFICSGATLFTIFSLKLGGTTDSARIAASIVTGVGFLGAGVILRDAGRIIGLTTASVIWLTAALGMGIGGGYYLLTSIAAAFMLFVLWLFPYIESWIDAFRGFRSFEVVFSSDPQVLQRLKQLRLNSGTHLRSQKLTKNGPLRIWSLQVFGKPSRIEQFIEQLIADPDVQELR